MEVLKVAAKSNPNSVAGALANTIREHGGAELQAIGAGALNQAVKAIIIARGYVAPSGIDLVCIPAFTDIDINGEERTAIKLIVQSKIRKSVLSTLFFYEFIQNNSRNEFAILDIAKKLIYYRFFPIELTKNE